MLTLTHFADLKSLYYADHNEESAFTSTKSTLVSTELAFFMTITV